MLLLFFTLCSKIPKFPSKGLMMACFIYQWNEAFLFFTPSRSQMWPWGFLFVYIYLGKYRDRCHYRLKYSSQTRMRPNKEGFCNRNNNWQAFLWKNNHILTHISFYNMVKLIHCHHFHIHFFFPFFDKYSNWTSNFKIMFI